MRNIKRGVDTSSTIFSKWMYSAYGLVWLGDQEGITSAGRSGIEYYPAAWQTHLYWYGYITRDLEQGDTKQWFKIDRQADRPVSVSLSSLLQGPLRNTSIIRNFFPTRYMLRTRA